MVDEDALRVRYALVEIDDEGVLLDRESGAVFRVNTTACAIWRDLLAGDSVAQIATMLARRFAIDADLALRDTLRALAVLPSAGSSDARSNNEIDCRWEVAPDGYAFRERGVVTCLVDPAGQKVRLPPGVKLTEREARGRLRSVVARVLALRGIELLHASAVEIDGALTVFSGRSGAGKTTTARALARAGARLVSEDLLVLAPSARAVVAGEAAIRSWVGLQAARLAADPVQPVAGDGLDQCVGGETLGIREILLIDAARRAGERIQSARLSRPEALLALLESVYFASPDAHSWLARFETLRQLVTTTRTSSATVPSGLALLDAAAPDFRSDQREMIAS